MVCGSQNGIEVGLFMWFHGFFIGRSILIVVYWRCVCRSFFRRTMAGTTLICLYQALLLLLAATSFGG